MVAASMSDKSTIGIATVVIGLLIVIAATKGTLNNLWNDVVLGSAPNVQSGNTSATTPVSMVPNDTGMVWLPTPQGTPILGPE